MSLYGIFAGTVKGLDPEVLFDPFEEEFDLPAASIDTRDCQWRQGEVIGQKREILSGLGIVISDAPKSVRVVLGGVKRAQDDGLVADDSSRSIHGPGVSTPESNMALGSDYEESGFDGKPVEPVEIKVCPVHNVEGSSFRRNLVEYVHLMPFSIRNMEKRWDIPAQVQERVNLDSRLVLTKVSPWKQ